MDTTPELKEFISDQIERRSKEDASANIYAAFCRLLEHGELKQSPRWVKASERLPQKGECILRVTGGEKLDRKTICIGWLHSDKDQIDAKKGKVTLTYSGISLSKVEWLDESESPKEEAVEFAEWIRDNDYSQSNRSGGEWYDPTVGDSDVVYYTTQELYNLFRQTK